MTGRQHEKVRLKIACIFFLALSLALSGCTGDSTEGIAEAAQGRDIETFGIFINTFVLETDDEPTINILDQSTQYTLTSTGTVSFTKTVGGTENISLDSGEIVIERPATATVTVIQFK